MSIDKRSIMPKDARTANGRNFFIKTDLMFLIAVFAVSFFVRFFLMSQGPYHVDCLNLALQAQKTLETHQLQFAFGSGYPLNVLLAAVFIGVAQFLGCSDPVLAVNFMSVVFGALGVAAFYVFLRLVLDQTSAWMGAVLFCFDPILWGTSVYGMNHSPSLFFLITGLCFFFRYLKTGRRKDFLISAAAIGLMGATRLQDMLLILPAVIYAVVFLKEGKFSEKLASGCYLLLIAGAVTFFFHLPYLFNTQTSGYGHQWQEYWKQGFTQFEGKLFLFLPNALSALVENFSLFGIILAAASLMLLVIQEPRFAVFLVLWFVVPLFSLSCLAGMAPRFLVVIIPAVITVQVYALSNYTNGSFWMRWTVFGVLGALVLYSVTLMYPILNYRHERSEVIRSSQWIERITPSDSIVFAGDEGAFIAHYGKRNVLKPPICWGGCTQEQFLSFKTFIKDQTSEGRPVYITSMGLQADDPNGEFQKFVADNFRLVLVGKCWTEDWHHDCMVLRLGWIKLYQMFLK